MLARTFFICLFTCLRGTAKKPEVAELITTCDCLIINHGRARGPTSHSIIHEGNKLVLLEFVYDHENALLHITNNDSASLCLESDNQVGYDLRLSFSEKLSHTEIVNSQVLSNSGQKSSLES